MLDINNGIVDENYKSLPDTYICEMDMISPKKQINAMGVYGHLGHPSCANKEIGRCLNQNSAQYIALVAKKFVERTSYESYMFHSLYSIPFFHLKFLKFR
jgi:creatinine amidohydrolase